MTEWLVSSVFLLILGLSPWKTPSALITDCNSSLSTCDLIVDAGPDTNVCFPGGTLNLQGSASGSISFVQWIPPTGLNNSTILNPIANITSPITYTLVAYGIDPDNPNLVVNGDFEAGNTGFSSDYTYVMDLPVVQNEMVPAGTYTVINNPNLVHSGFSPCNDHTAGGDQMMVINGAPSLQNVWCQTIAINPNTWYNISAWAASVHSASPAILRFSINGTPIGPVLNAPSNTCQWVPFNANWNSGSNTSATICILNLNTASGGNDFALDDISMVELCSVEDEVEITLLQEIAPAPEIEGPAFLCVGETGIYSVDFPPDPAIESYVWTVPSGATILNGQGTSQVTVLWNEPMEESICLMIETRCDMNEACYDVIVGDVPDLPQISGPYTLCPGETATLYVPEQNPDDQYDWILPPSVTLISGEGTNEIDVEWNMEGEAEICIEVTNACGSTDNCTFLSLLPVNVTMFDTVLCLGTTITINGHIYGNGVWTGTELFTSINGCDSTVQISISEASSLEFMVTQYLCPGDSIFLQGAFQNIPGTYVDSFTTISGCDSLVITEVIISPLDTTWIISTTCNPTEAGTTITTFQQGLCDSTVITQILLLASDTTFITSHSCSLLDTGLVIQHLSNLAGCDSMVITHTLYLQADTTLLFYTSCDPADVGIITDTLNNINGCDSLVISQTAFLQSDTTYISNLTCVYADTGTTTALLINATGCDSLVITSTLYAGSDTTFYSGASCFPVDTGLVINHLTNQFGCDSIISTFISMLPTDTTYLSLLSCQPLDTGVLVQNLSNQSGCDSTVITTTSLIPLSQCTIQAVFSIQQPKCYGDTAWLMADVQLGLQPFQLSISDGNINTTQVISDTGTYNIPLQMEGEIFIEISSANGLLIRDTLLVDSPDPLAIKTENVNDYTGFGLPCYGDSIGEILVNILSPGTPPLNYRWSTSENSPHIANLKAGEYFVTVTDHNECQAVDSIQLTEPAAMQFEIDPNDVSCFGLNDGTLALENIQGGLSPWLTSLDGNSFAANINYADLNAGLHTIVAKDPNGCIVEKQFTIMEPEYWSMSLGPDTSLAFGSNFLLSATITGSPSGQLSISWSDGQCDDCLTRSIEATSDIVYHIMATDENGCSAEDDLRIHVAVDRSLYIPTIFSPNGDQINDQFIITMGPFVEEVQEFSIYDRWGNLVFSEFNLQPDDPALSWDGHAHDRLLNPGVYLYKLQLKFKDGKELVKFGDVTLMR
jgi:gliding motility-associated-like protein